MMTSQLSLTQPRARKALWAATAASTLAVGLALQQLPAAGQAPAAKAETAAPEKKPAQKVTSLGDIVVKSQKLDYDTDNRRVYFTGSVDLTSKESHLTADKMVVDLTEDNELKLAHCEGKVFIEKKNPEDGQTMTAHADTLDYSEVAQTAALNGNAEVFQTSPKLAKPAHIVGHKIDMDLEKKINVVSGNSASQAKVHIDPKGEEGKPAPEPVDLTADRIEMRSLTQEYVATGKPLMKRPSSSLAAKRIRFQVDEKTNEVQIAYADDNVIVDSRTEDGSLMHATGDNAVYNKQTNEVTLDGNVNAETRKTKDEEPTVYQGKHYVYNMKTRISTLSGDAVVRIPKKPAPPKPAAADDKKPAEKKDADAK